MAKQRLNRTQRQFTPQAARLLEQLRSVSEQYRGAIAEADPELADAMELCAARLRDFLEDRDTTPAPTEASVR